MKSVTSTFLKGLFTLLPLLLSIYILFWLLGFSERFARNSLLFFWPDSIYVPGMGLVLMCVLIYAFGVVIDKPLAKWAFGAVDGLFSQVPLVKSVYMAIKDFTNFLKPDKNRKSNQVVLVKMPNYDFEIIGFLTRENLDDLPDPITKDDRVAVYFPMSYQIGGYTLFIPRTWIKPTPMSVENTMRSVLTAWLPGGAQKLEVSE